MSVAHSPYYKVRMYNTVVQSVASMYDLCGIFMSALYIRTY